MAEPKRILVIVDPTAASQPALERAAWLAERLPAKLELFICDYAPHLVDQSVFDPSSLAAARKSLIASHVRRLEELARPLTAKGLTVAVDARWDSPLYEGIVRKAVESRAELVLKDTHYHPVLKRSIFSNTDWNLVRTCPTPLWLVKPRAVGLKPCIVAAVDPLHERDKPAELDHRIIAAGEELTAALGGELHVLHAYDIAPILASSSDSLTMPIALPIQELSEILRNEHTDAVHELTDAHKIPRERVHIQQGGTRQALCEITEQLRADLVVMGAVSRSGLKRLFLGNTAEDVLDRLDCDLLIVKPAELAPDLPS